MSFTVIFSPEAQEDLEKLNKFESQRILKKIRHFKSLDNILPVSKKLVNSTIGEYRLRVGNYRLVFDLDKNEITLLNIQHRKDVYR